MGNAMKTPCFHPNNGSSKKLVKLVFWEGTSRSLKGKHIAGEIMFEFPEMMVCHAESFFIGHPIPVLSIDDELMQGETYFVLPIDRFACSTLSVASISAFGSCPNKSPIKFGACPFQYLKGSDGRIVIKVMPEFITRLITGGDGAEKESVVGPSSFLCSTPELQKHYEQLVKSKDQVWSPKLETISEYRIRFSPCRFIEWKEKEKPAQILTR
ncbi:uncharacterized protein LOC114193869 [Vigna unguiculata]|uniref:Uncharacterized protein n=1 Tax=Vigna unguiculata TaxID=3917 RepID=A0A4D6MNN1_VIGUN|nr:uncharacterized protein LOC114193869 [Vigna unguiculata]QCE01587.1 hypothetical protein DEO72_LG7g2886 [Vigna unguiculata]